MNLTFQSMLLLRLPILYILRALFRLHSISYFLLFVQRYLNITHMPDVPQGVLLYDIS